MYNNTSPACSPLTAHTWRGRDHLHIAAVQDFLGSMSGLVGPVRTELDCWDTTAARFTRQRTRRRPSPLLLLTAATTWASLVAPFSRAWVLPLSQRRANTSLRRLRTPLRKGPPFRRRPCDAAQEAASRTLSLSSAAPTVDATVSWRPTAVEILFACGCS